MRGDIASSVTNVAIVGSTVGFLTVDGKAAVGRKRLTVCRFVGLYEEAGGGADCMEGLLSVYFRSTDGRLSVFTLHVRRGSRTLFAGPALAAPDVRGPLPRR